MQSRDPATDWGPYQTWRRFNVLARVLGSLPTKTKRSLFQWMRTSGPEINAQMFIPQIGVTTGTLAVFMVLGDTSRHKWDEPSVEPALKSEEKQKAQAPSPQASPSKKKKKKKKTAKNGDARPQDDDAAGPYAGRNRGRRDGSADGSAAGASQNPSAGQQLLDEAGTAELSTDKKSVGKQLSGAVRGLAQNYVALCAVVGLIVFLLMCLMRPPMVLKPASSLLTRPTLSLAKAALWGLGTASVMIAAPVVYKLYKKKAADD